MPNIRDLKKKRILIKKIIDKHQRDIESHTACENCARCPVPRLASLNIQQMHITRLGNLDQLLTCAYLKPLRIDSKFQSNL